jgi:hypothetical protein
VDETGSQTKVAPMRNQHIWTELASDGVKREVRVTKQAKKWRFQAKRSDETSWTYYDRPLLADLREFKEVLFRKYQRRRASYEDFVWVERELVRAANERLASDVTES